jgi:hypothetical protein
MSEKKDYNPTDAYIQGGLHLEVAKLIGSPINKQLPVPVELTEIADTFTAEPGEHVWRYENIDDNVDVVYKVDPDCLITPIKRTPLNDIEVTFDGYNSKMEYVCVEDVLNKVDTDILARRKASIARAMDKATLKNILDAILTPTATIFPANDANNNLVTVATGDDLYDIIMKMKHAVEDFGDDYILLVGSTVKEKLDTYDKDNVTAFNYNITIQARLAQLGIKVMKIFGKVSIPANGTDPETESEMLDKNTMILVARNSRITEGKPIKFVRRKISAEIARLMGADVDDAERATIVNPVPVQDNGNRLAFGVYGYESRTFLITNSCAISVADATLAVT